MSQAKATQAAEKERQRISEHNVATETMAQPICLLHWEWKLTLLGGQIASAISLHHFLEANRLVNSQLPWQVDINVGGVIFEALGCPILCRVTTDSRRPPDILSLSSPEAAGPATVSAALEHDKLWKS